MSIRSLVVVAVLAACGSRPAPDPGVGNSSTAGIQPAPAPTPTERAAPWIARLDNPREAARAVDELEQLGDPTAIVAGERKPELGGLVIETTIVRNYFRRRGTP